MYPSEYANLIQALAELMQEQNLWTPEAAFFARYFCKATGMRATLPTVEMTKNSVEVSVEETLTLTSH